MDVNMVEITGSEPELAQPNLYDYLAGAMLANGFIWIWNQSLGVFREFFSMFSPGLLADITYLIYLAITIIASMQVCKRANTNHLVVGIKFAGASWALFLINLFSMAPDPTIGYAISFLPDKL